MSVTSETQQQTIEAVKHSADGGAFALAFASWLDYLPSIAAVLSVVWLSLRIYETVLNLIDRWKEKKDEVS